MQMVATFEREVATTSCLWARWDSNPRHTGPKPAPSGQLGYGPARPLYCARPRRFEKDSVWLWQDGHRYRRFSRRLSIGSPLMWSISRIRRLPHQRSSMPHAAHLCGTPRSSSARRRNAVLVRGEGGSSRLSISCAGLRLGEEDPRKWPCPVKCSVEMPCASMLRFTRARPAPLSTRPRSLSVPSEAE